LMNSMSSCARLIGILQRNGDDQKLLQRKLPQLSKNYNPTSKPTGFVGEA